MSWFYIGNKDAEKGEMVYQVVHQFDQVQEVGGIASATKPTIQRIPCTTIDLETTDRELAAARVHYLNGGSGHFGPSEAANDDD